jgi:hypothetical protein
LASISAIVEPLSGESTTPPLWAIIVPLAPMPL